MSHTHPSPGFRGDIEIEIFTERLNEHYLISPNDLHRGHSGWQGMTLRGRAMLSALLTYRSGWKVDRKFIDRLAPELGHKGVSTVLTELESRGHLSREKVNGADGKFTWRWTVRMAPTTMMPSGDDGQNTMMPSGDDGSDQGNQGVSAGRTIVPSATDGQGDVFRSTFLPEVPSEELPPYPPAPTAAAPVVSETVTGEGEENGSTTEDLDPVAVAAAEACRYEPTWTIPGTIAAVRAAMAARLPGPVATRAIVAIASGQFGPTTSGPQRLLARGPWWTPGEVFVPAPAVAPSESCPRHRGQLARNCSWCRAEELAGDGATAGAGTPTGSAARPQVALAAPNRAAVAVWGRR